MKKIPNELIEKLSAPLAAEAVKQHPTKKFLSTIKAIYISERLNDVFGLGAWSMTYEIIDKQPAGKSFHVVVLVTLSIHEYELNFQHFGGNDNPDLGDAYKGAVSDALSKIAATHLHIGLNVYKGTHGQAPQQPKVVDNTTQLDAVIDLMNKVTSLEELQEVFTKYVKQFGKYSSFVSAKDVNKTRLQG